jgi:hypothetical protein
MFVPSLIWIASDNLTAEILSITSFTLAFIFHNVFAEWWIRHRQLETSAA